MRRVYAPEDCTPTAIDRLVGNPLVVASVGAVLLGVPVVLGLGAWQLFGEEIRYVLSCQLGFSLLLMGLCLFLIIHVCGACTLAERKVSAFMQDRKGPNRVGFWGILQPALDGAKFLLKEDIVPAKVDKPIFILAPGLALAAALISFAVIPWGGVIEWPWGGSVRVQVASLDVGILYFLAVGALSVYGVVLAGWASNNKYSFFGGMRATAQMISYEIPIGLGVLVVLLIAGSLRLEEIVAQQVESGVWFVFLHPLAFMIMLIAVFAETNRAPFDVVECEQELIAGFHTEYTSMKLAMFYLAEYAHMTMAGVLLTVLFLGGGSPLPFVRLLADNHTWWAALIQFGVVWGKASMFLLFFMVVRWTVPRFRFDQIVKLAWKSLVPMGLLLVLACGVLAAFDLHKNPLATLSADGLILGVSLWYASRSSTPITGRQDNLPDIQVRPAAQVEGL